MKMKLTDNQIKKITAVCIAIFIAVLSAGVLSKWIPQRSFCTKAEMSLEETNERVVAFSASTLAMSVAITLLPDDYATPLADSLADMNKYFILILGIVFLEKLLVTQGIPLVFLYVVPILCVMFVGYYLTGKEFIKNIAIKILILTVAVVIVVPCSTRISDFLCADGMAYVDETISDAEKGSDKVDEITESSNDDNFFDKIANAFQTVIKGVEDLFDYFKDIVKKCIYSIAILIVASCVIPVLTFMLFVWLLNQLFQLQNNSILIKQIATAKFGGEKHIEEINEEKE
ncbi:MAG: hypothetical protein K6E13_08465 [Lachnospiraceae bacterium]|nr:hypothetical protein [Lachnospiraceae bacterium]